MLLDTSTTEFLLNIHSKIVCMPKNWQRNTKLFPARQKEIFQPVCVACVFINFLYITTFPPFVLGIIPKQQRWEYRNWIPNWGV